MDAPARRSIYGCTASDFTPPPDCRYTQRGNRLYLHLFAWPFRHVHLEGLAGRVEYAQLLNDASEIRMSVFGPGQQAETITPPGGRPDTLTLELPIQRPPVAVPVIELFMRDGNPGGQMTKIAFIGAGSFGFTRGLVRDILTFPLLKDATLSLMDIDPERLDFAQQAVQRIVEWATTRPRSRPPSTGPRR